MKKQIIVLSMMTALSACQLDNRDDKKVAANFNNQFSTQVGFDGTEGKGLDVEVTFGHGSAAGVIIVTDVNFGEAKLDYSKAPEAIYGTFAIAENNDGEASWSYDLDETLSEVLTLQGNVNATLTETLTLTSLDGTTTDLNILIKGVASDIPAEFRGALVANVSLTGTEAFGKAEVYDANFAESAFQAVGETNQPKYGTFVISPEGRWEYNLNKRHPDLQSLVTPEDSTSETFTIYSTDGTPIEFTVNITGAPLNFAAQVPSSTDETNVFAVDFAQSGLKESSGKLVFNAQLTLDLATFASIGMTCGNWNSNNDGGGDNRRLAQFYAQADGQFEMWSAEIVPGGSYDKGSADYAKNESNQFITEKVVFDQMFTPGEWSTFTMTWDHDAGSALTYLTLSLDDTPVSSSHGAIPADPTQRIVAQTVAGTSLYRCLEEVRFTVRKNADLGGTGALLIDDIKYFANKDADVKFDTPDFVETFSNNNVGDLVKDISSNGAKHFQSITTDNITVVSDR
ncbi:VCBS domain-containing protein [Catenovulum agarivorans]|uniref:VCBS domain-containing protein n=1 Tax=Catenovulum agarivorans TaxID=1172192 RepID=UPI0003114852|nr:VCBS domain-containing protein [Catenovulum agarivorans]